MFTISLSINFANVLGIRVFFVKEEVKTLDVVETKDDQSVDKPGSTIQVPEAERDEENGKEEVNDVKSILME